MEYEAGSNICRRKSRHAENACFLLRRSDSKSINCSHGITRNVRQFAVLYANVGSLPVPGPARRAWRFNPLVRGAKSAP
jgi:hypothetical protein